MIAAWRAEHLDATRPLIEATVGRPLRQAEHVVDVFRLTKALDDAKDAVHEAITAEQARAVRDGLRTGHPIRLHVTRAMLTPLERLFRKGVTEAFDELRRAGYNPSRALAEHDPRPFTSRLDDVADTVASGLNSFSVRLQMLHDETRLRLVVSGHGSVGDALAKALLAQPGGRSIAAGVVSTALFRGMGQTFEENESIVGGWEYTSVLDGGTCEVCEPLDGTTYDSWAEIQEVLPNGGPNPECLGGDRCRCRALPVAAG